MIFCYLIISIVRFLFLVNVVRPVPSFCRSSAFLCGQVTRDNRLDVTAVVHASLFIQRHKPFKCFMLHYGCLDVHKEGSLSSHSILTHAEALHCTAVSGGLIITTSDLVAVMSLAPEEGMSVAVDLRSDLTMLSSISAKQRRVWPLAFLSFCIWKPWKTANSFHKVLRVQSSSNVMCMDSGGEKYFFKDIVDIYIL